MRVFFVVAALLFAFAAPAYANEAWYRSSPSHGTARFYSKYGAGVYWDFDAEWWAPKKCRVTVRFWKNGVLGKTVRRVAWHDERTVLVAPRWPEPTTPYTGHWRVTWRFGPSIDGACHIYIATGSVHQ